MDTRMVNIWRLVVAFSEGNFSKRIKLSDRHDDTDALLGALHMLGEELSVLTVSRDYFTDIFDSMAEMALVITPRGTIEELNKVVVDRLGYKKSALVGKALDTLAGDGGGSLSRQLRKEPGPDGLVRIWERSFLTAQGAILPVEMVVRPLPGRGARGKGPVLLTAKEIGPRLAAENRLLRAVIDAQEQERGRLARDLHDGLGQQLSAIKFLVSAAEKESGSSELKEKLQAANESLLDVLHQTRRLCRNLMPASLEDFGLIEAVRELGAQLEHAGMMHVLIEVGRNLPELSRSLEIDLYRVVQEFAANAMRHGEATWLEIHFAARNDGLEVRLRDNGKGFDPVTIQGVGMGLRNMHSRIRSHRGLMELKSGLGKGTEVFIRVMPGLSYV